MGRAVEQDRAQRQVDGDVHGALEGHVQGPVDLGRRAGQVDRDVAALDRHRDRDPEITVGGVLQVREAVDEALRRIAAIWQLLDLSAEHPLGVVHQLLAGRHHPLYAEALDQLHKALGADLAGRHLGLHVTHHHVRRPDVVSQHPPEGLVLDPLLGRL